MAALDSDINDPLHFLPLPNPSAEQQHDHNNNHNQTCIDDLSDALLELIFRRLFLWKQICTCKFVSKRWNSIISNPDFFRVLTRECFPFTLVLGRGGGARCLITEHPYFKKHQLCLDFLPGDMTFSGHKYVDIIAHHRDLLISYRSPNPEQSAYYIANPLTKQFIVVPLTWTQAMHNFPVSDINYRSHYWPIGKVGFAGFVAGVTNPYDDSKNDGFRIVRIIKLFNPNQTIVQIYSSQTGQWKTSPMNYFDFAFETSTSWNNKLYWHSESQILVMDPFVDDIVATRLINLPDEIHRDSVLGVCRNQLRIAQFEANGLTNQGGPRIKAWEFKDRDDLDTLRNNNTTVGLRLVIDFALEPSIVGSASSSINLMYANPVYHKENRVVCCHPNDPDIVYFFYLGTLFYCDGLGRRHEVRAHCTNNRNNKVSDHCTSDWNGGLVFLHLLVTP